MKRLAAYIALLIALCLLANTVFANDDIANTDNGIDSRPQTENRRGTKPLLVIIIDDLGNNLERGRRAVELPGALTYGILPHTPLAQKLAYYATQINADKEIIVHMPMEAVGHQHLGPGGLETHYDKSHFIDTLRDAMQAIPFAKGLSNHMGSKLTAMPDRMAWLMAELGNTNFYFIDSKTTGASAAMSAADHQDVPYLARDIFLDHNPGLQAISRAYDNALALAYQKGLAVVVAHPYPTTLEFLERALPMLDDHGVNLVNASEALKATGNTAVAERIVQITRRTAQYPPM